MQHGGFPVAQTVKNMPEMWETWIRSLGQEDPLEKGMATHSSILAWRIPGTEKPGGLQSMLSQRDTTKQLTHTHTHTHTLCNMVMRLSPSSWTVYHMTGQVYRASEYCWAERFIFSIIFFFLIFILTLFCFAILYWFCHTLT